MFEAWSERDRIYRPGFGLGCGRLSRSSNPTSAAGRGRLLPNPRLPLRYQGAAMAAQDWIEYFRVEPGTKVKLKKFDTGWSVDGHFADLGKNVAKEKAEELLRDRVKELTE